MKKGIFYLTCCFFSFTMVIPTMAAGNRQHSEVFDERVNALKNRFPEGKYWQHTGANNPDSVLDYPVCSKNSHTYQEMETGSCGCNSYSAAIQCNGFAKYEAQIVFGTSAANQWIEYNNLNKDAGENISIGDYVRIPGHSLFIIDINGDKFTSYSCWGSQGSKIAIEEFTKQQLNSKVELFRHANNYDDIFKASAPPPQVKEDWFWETNGGFWKYQLSDGSFAKGWWPISDSWYYFKADASLTWGCWERIGGKWYHFHADGRMETDWKEIDGNFYYLGDDGAMRENEWVDEYYLGSGGAMYRNMCATVNGIEYEFDSEGEATAVSESKTQYSFRTRTQEYEYRISNSDSLDGWEYVEAVSGNSNEWGAWSDWSSEYVEGSDNIEVEERTVDTETKTQIYLGRYYSESHNDFSPTKKDESYSFEGGWYDKDEVTFRGEVFKGGRKDCYTISGYGYYFFEIGEDGGQTREVSSGSQTEYHYRERLKNTQYKFRRYRYSDWSEWSSWSETPITSDELTDVRTQRK